MVVLFGLFMVVLHSMSATIFVILVGGLTEKFDAGFIRQDFLSNDVDHKLGIIKGDFISAGFF